MLDFASPASMSIHEELTITAGIPMMGVFNNLVVFDQHVPQNSLKSIVPDLATGWSWSEDGKELTFPLRQGVKWHDGKPFTAADVKCTWDRLRGVAGRQVPPQPAQGVVPQRRRHHHERRLRGHFSPGAAAALSDGAARLGPIAGLSLPCLDGEMRTHPIGTGPFKFVEYKPNERIQVTRNADYWKKDRPYLDGIEYTIIANPATWHLAFVAGKLDFIFSTIPLMKDLKSQAPKAVCDVVMDNNSRDLLVNRAVAPFDKPDLRQAIALSLDRQAFIDILAEGQGAVGGAVLPPPDGVWGMTPEILHTLPGYGPDVAKNREEGRAMMRKLGYGPDNRLAVKLSTRNVPAYRDAAVIAISQLREVYIDAELEAGRHGELFPAHHAQGLQARRRGQHRRPRRARPEILRELCLRRRAQPDRLLRHGDRPADRRAIDGGRRRQAAASWCGRSSAGWRKTRRGRSSSIRGSAAAGSPMSRGW